MLFEQTMEKLYAMKLNGMAQAMEEQRQQADVGDLAFEERFRSLGRPAMDLARRPGSLTAVRQRQTAATRLR